MGVDPPGFLDKKKDGAKQKTKQMGALLEVKFISGSPASNTHTHNKAVLELVGAVRAQHSGCCAQKCYNH